MHKQQKTMTIRAIVFLTFHFVKVFFSLILQPLTHIVSDTHEPFGHLFD